MMNSHKSAEPTLLGAVDAAPVAVGPSQLTLDWDQELAAVLSYHEHCVADGEQTWHHYLFYRSGERLCRLKVRGFERGTEKDSVFTVGAMLAPLLRADEVLWLADTRLSVVDVSGDAERAELRTLLERDQKASGANMVEFLRAHQERAPTLDALVVIGIGSDYWRAQFLPYAKHDGTVEWHTAMFQLTDSVVERERVVQFETGVVDVVQELLRVDTTALPGPESLVYVLSRSGYEVKMYED